MSDAIIVAIISGLFTAGGAIISVFTANRVTTYKIERLEEQVKKHNNLIERMFKVEEQSTLLFEKIAVANHRIDDLEKEANKTK